MSVASRVAAGLILASIGGCAGAMSPDGLLSAEKPAASPDRSQMGGSAMLVSLRPVVGPPDPMQVALARELNEAASSQNVALVADSSVQTRSTLTGYMVAQPVRDGVKLTYVWDIATSDGRRLERISGEELLPAAKTGGDVWAEVSPEAMRVISAKAIAGLAAVPR